MVLERGESRIKLSTNSLAFAGNMVSDVEIVVMVNDYKPIEVKTVLTGFIVIRAFRRTRPRIKLISKASEKFYGLIGKTVNDREKDALKAKVKACVDRATMGATSFSRSTLPPGSDLMTNSPNSSAPDKRPRYFIVYSLAVG